VVCIRRVRADCCECGGHQSGKTYATVGELGEFARMGVVARIASDILDRLSSSASARTDLVLTISCFVVGAHSDRPQARDLLSSPPATRPV